MDFTKYIVTLSEEELEEMKDLVDDNSEHIWDTLRIPSAAYPDLQIIPATYHLAFLLKESGAHVTLAPQTFKVAQELTNALSLAVTDILDDVCAENPPEDLQHRMPEMDCLLNLSIRDLLGPTLEREFRDACWGYLDNTVAWKTTTPKESK